MIEHTPVIAVPTSEWQQMKLGPNARREARWAVVEMHYRRRVAARAMADVLTAVDRIGAALRSIAPVLRRVNDQLVPLGRALADQSSRTPQYRSVHRPRQKAARW